MSVKQHELFESRPAAILQLQEIEELIEEGWLVEKTHFEHKNLGACSYDIRIGTRGILGGTSKEIDLVKESLELLPGAYGGVISLEKIKLPKWVCARIGSKRAFAYEGIIVLTGSMVDPSYEGHLLFGIYNASPHKYPIRYGQKLCNIVFERLEKQIEATLIPDSRLFKGEFPDSFLTSMSRMEVEPLMQLGERLSKTQKELDQAFKEIAEIRTRYDDVLQPIKELEGIVKQNNQQIAQVTDAVSKLTTKVSITEEKSLQMINDQEKVKTTLDDLKLKFGKLSWISYLIYGVFIFLAGIVAKYFIDKMISK